jgi:uncharacterized membrane protein YccC
MDHIKAYLSRSLFMVMFFTLMLLAVAVFIQYPLLKPLINIYTGTYTIIFILLFALLQWMFMRNSLIKALAKTQLSPTKAIKKVKSQAATAREREKEANEHRRQFLHLFSVLQREGRLMDFLSEELNQYDDEQIGAAVRNIHSSCQKTIAKYIHPQAVLKEEEGSEIEIPIGFDPMSIKLTGNVVGDPPFKGIIRHRGWKTKKFELPVLSENQNPLIIAPAEVEVE